MSIQEVPERIAFLILMYMHEQITPEQHDELDAWVEGSDENMQLFEKLTDIESVESFYHL